jgi:predicted SAM-dependent methyltransferase
MSITKPVDSSAGLHRTMLPLRLIKVGLRRLLGPFFIPLKSWIQRTGFRLGFFRLKPPVKLHLGCGMRPLAGYVNIDMVCETGDILADCCDLAFLPSGIASHILNEHMLEHLGRVSAISALREWSRLLAPDGILEVEVPDILWCMEKFLAASEGERYGGPLYEGRGLIATVYGLQTTPGQFHQFGYTPDHLAASLTASGFEILDVKTYMTRHPCRSIRIRAKKLQGASPSR